MILFGSSESGYNFFSQKKLGHSIHIDAADLRDPLAVLSPKSIFSAQMIYIRTPEKTTQILWLSGKLRDKYLHEMADSYI